MRIDRHVQSIQGKTNEDAREKERFGRARALRIIPNEQGLPVSLHPEVEAGFGRRLFQYRCQGHTVHKPRGQVGEPHLTQLRALERDGDLTVNIGRRLCELRRRCVHDSLKRERLASTAHIHIQYTWELVAELQVHADAHRFSDIGGEQLWFVRPRFGIKVDEHVVARTQIAPRVNFGNLQQFGGIFGSLLRRMLCRECTTGDPTTCPR
eukprot:6601765-Prymnesium_polylepis.2